MNEQDHLDYLSLPTTLYDKIESDVADLLIELDIRSYPIDPMQIAAGVPLVTVAGRSGHARTSTTTDIYSHFLKSSDKTAAEKLEQIF